VSLAADREITGEALRVLVYVLGRMDFENWLRLPQAEVAHALGMHKQNVSRAIGRLVEKGVIEKSGTTVGGAHLYRVSHKLAWRGRVVNWKERDREKHVETRLRARRSGLKVIEGGAGGAARKKAERR
jgi:DNA-binding Lrp family transcriptional regulator